MIFVIVNVGHLISSCFGNQLKRQTFSNNSNQAHYSTVNSIKSFIEREDRIEPKKKKPNVNEFASINEKMETKQNWNRTKGAKQKKQSKEDKQTKLNVMWRCDCLLIFRVWTYIHIDIDDRAFGCLRLISKHLSIDYMIYIFLRFRFAHMMYIDSDWPSPMLLV